MSSRIVKSVLCATTAIGLCQAALMSGVAQAQDRDIEEVVVTGTLIRGVAPVGSSVIGISRDDIEAAGSADTNLLLGSLPQSSFFMDLPEPGGNGSQAGMGRVPINVPNLRNLPLAGIPSGNPTLVLLDGHRIVPVGIEQSAVDAGVIPQGIIERQEIVLDGTSAIYGTDAVGGVINYIPRKRFTGGEIDASYGIADNYSQRSANATAGWSWDTGGVGLNYTYNENDQILDRERESQRPRNWFEGGRDTGTACPGAQHVTSGTGTALRRFVVSGTSLRAATAADYCNLGYGDFRPAQTNHGGFLTFSQDLSETLTFDTTAFYGHRLQISDASPITTTATVRSTNPYFMSLTAFGIPNTTAQSVSVTFGPALGFRENLFATLVTEVAQVTPSLTWNVGSDWQVKGDFSYGQSKNDVDRANADTGVLATNLGGTTRATAINPYAPELSENLLLVGQVADFHDRRDSQHKFMQALVKADGPLFAIPGGEVRAAFGAEWSKTDFKKRVTPAGTHILGPYNGASVNQKALFGEVIAPIVGPDNRMSGVDSLVLSLSGRYDTYAFYGDTFNPKIALTYDPVDWVSFRGNWGKSFRAPNAADRVGALFSTAACIGGSGTLPPCGNAVQNIPAPIYTGTSLATIGNAERLVYINMGGSQAGLRPEKSKNWTVGVTLEPPVAPGLRLDASYYNIAFTDHINIANPQIALTDIFLNVPRLYAINPCILPTVNRACLDAPRSAAFEAAIQSFMAQTTNGQSVVQSVDTAGYDIAYVMDTRVTNLATFNLEGLDISVSYTYPTSWGSISARVNGNWSLKSETQFYPNTPVVSNLGGSVAGTTTSPFRGTFSLGATYGDFSATATLQHQAGYEIAAADLADYVGQTTIDQFDLVNLSFRYNVNGTHPLTQDLSLRMNINNVLDTDPPVTYTNTGGTANGRTLGRLIQFGITKKF